MENLKIKTRAFGFMEFLNKDFFKLKAFNKYEVTIQKKDVVSFYFTRSMADIPFLETTLVISTISKKYKLKYIKNKYKKQIEKYLLNR